MPADVDFSVDALLDQWPTLSSDKRAPETDWKQLLAELDNSTRREVIALVYKKDAAGGRMSPRFARLRPEMTVDEAVIYLRHQASHVETIYYAYVKGIVTVDDMVVQEEDTEDIQKIGGALDAPYLQTGFWRMVQKRAGWLAVLFVGEMLTATAMGHYEQEIAHAVVLTLFVPLIISRGGNSGSQATTLVIRAMAVGEVHLREWWRIVRREFATGVVLGSVLAVIGSIRIAWQAIGKSYGEHYVVVALTVACSLVGVVLFGTLAGSMLPFILRRLSLDPAGASAPLVATLVAVSGLVIYFTVASVIMRGTLL